MQALTDIRYPIVIPKPNFKKSSILFKLNLRNRERNSKDVSEHIWRSTIYFQKRSFPSLVGSFTMKSNIKRSQKSNYSFMSLGTQMLTRLFLRKKRIGPIFSPLLLAFVDHMTIYSSVEIYSLYVDTILFPLAALK